MKLRFTLLPTKGPRRVLALTAFLLLYGAIFVVGGTLAMVGANARALKSQFFGSAGFQPALSQVPSGKDVVSPSVFVSLDPAGRGSKAQIAVVMKIRPGFHVNAREKSEEYLIATDLKSEIPAGFSAGEVAYPKGKLEKFTFSREPLNVYQDTVVLKMPLTVQAGAPLGEQKIPMKLRYQACSTELCLPPATLNIEAVVNVAASASASKPAHPEIFKAK